MIRETLAQIRSLRGAISVRCASINCVAGGRPRPLGGDPRDFGTDQIAQAVDPHALGSRPPHSPAVTRAFGLVFITDYSSFHTSYPICASTASVPAYDGTASITTPRPNSGP
jgi:hypothetical protein